MCTVDWYDQCEFGYSYFDCSIHSSQNAWQTLHARMIGLIHSNIGILIQKMIIRKLRLIRTIIFGRTIMTVAHRAAKIPP